VGSCIGGGVLLGANGRARSIPGPDGLEIGPVPNILLRHVAVTSRLGHVRCRILKWGSRHTAYSLCYTLSVSLALSTPQGRALLLPSFTDADSMTP
jgi:hypothetical protein